ncbi:MAG: hypothetical protein BWY06_03121 [Candidatus Latescibacteria bacterium ADurb.Bin168]|nr:MAG: hypothetical protein BWY06_03121 [Candidatus Latescibacteria bacterium ADurb.Bin168]
MRWVDFPNDSFVVNGLPWFGETKPKLWRLPERMKAIVRPPVWDLATNPSGGRIRFRTNSCNLSIRANFTTPATYCNISIIGQMGYDLYSDGVYWRSFSPHSASAPNAGVVEEAMFENHPREWRDICVYTPIYAPGELLAFGVDDGAEFQPPSPFAVEKPVVFYGSSITQGGCASRPGMSYQAILGRALNIDFVNLGFSGNGMGEPELAEAMAEIEASCYVVDFAQNVGDPAKLREVYGPFLSVLRAKRPDTPIVCNTPIYASKGLWWPEGQRALEGQRQVIRDAVAERKAMGDTRVWLTEGTDFLGPSLSDAFVDGVHPSDLGFQAMADGFRPVIARILGLA